MSFFPIFSLLMTTFFLVNGSFSTTLPGIPRCWQDCIGLSGVITCSALDVSCVCRGLSGSFLTTALTCIKNKCGGIQDASLLISPLQLTCELAGAPIPSSVISSALTAATTTAVRTSYITSTITESYYLANSLATVATTVVMPMTEGNGNTVLVAFPFTIEPSTTIFGSPSTSTPEAAIASTATPPKASASASASSFGTCSNPGIIYGYGLDGTNQYSFEPADQQRFPHNSSVDIATIEAYICIRLQDEKACRASPDAQQICWNAFNAYSGLAGQNAANVWNIALGLSVNGVVSKGPSVGADTITNSMKTSSQPGQSTTSSRSAFVNSAPSSTQIASTTTVVTKSTSSQIASTTTTVTKSTSSQRSTATSASNAGGGGSPFDSQSSANQQWTPSLDLGVLVGLLSVAFIH